MPYLSGQAGVLLTPFYESTFGVMDTAYDYRKALVKGILSPVIIKYIVFPLAVTMPFKPPPLYIDVGNTYWTDDLLVSYSEAIQLISQYDARFD